jgi:hypothetical protein
MMPMPEPIKRRQRHDRDAADVFQHARLDRIVGAIHHDLEAVLDQRRRGLERFRHVGEQRLRIAQHFELAQCVAVEQFAAEAQGAHRVVRRVAAGGVGQDGELRGRQGFEDRGLPGFLADVGAADGDRDDLGARGVDGFTRLREVLVLAGADQQARVIGLPAMTRESDLMVCES